MALDLSINSDRWRSAAGRSLTTTSPPSTHDHTTLTMVSKRVRFAGSTSGHLTEYHHHPYHGLKAGGWRRKADHHKLPLTPLHQVYLTVTDSDEENLPPPPSPSSPCSPSSPSSPCSPSSSCHSRLSEEEIGIHPATRSGHMTLPVRIVNDVNLHHLPTDPREWSRAHVSEWLVFMKSSHDLNDLQPERFLMNGKALCLMNVNMFSYRVPNGGPLLYRDFRTRLSRALTDQSPTLPVMTSSYVTTPAQA